MTSPSSSPERERCLKRKLDERLGPCDICQVEKAKYTCPACEVHSCSLKCTAKHKVDADCDGVRIKTSYVPMKEFDDLQFLSDYRLLEEVGRKVETYSKDKSKRYTRFDQSLPLHLHRLRKAVFHRGTRFHFLPEHFSRRKNNTTYLNWRTKQIDWRVQITFLNAEMQTYLEDRCPESTTVGDLVQKYVNAMSSLKSYHVAGRDSIEVLIKAEKYSGGSRFYKLNLNESLKDNLYGKTVVEYPQLYVVIRNFFVSKTDGEKKEEVKAKSCKNTDFLQLKQQKDDPVVVDTTKAVSESSESEDDAHELLSYRDLIKT